jgi:hypothetical protein
MPYCEDCAKYWTPSAMNADGTCPTCGRTVDAPQKASVVTAKNVDVKKLAAVDGDDASAPWHFKLLVVLTAGYLVWRFVQLFT